MVKAGELERVTQIALSTVRELEEEKSNGSSQSETTEGFNDNFDDESDDVSILGNSDIIPQIPSCNLKDKIEKFKQLIHAFDDFYDNKWKNKMDPLYKKLEKSTLSKKEKIKIMLCGAYLENYGEILGEEAQIQLKDIFLPEHSEYTKDIDMHLDSNQHLKAGMNKLAKHGGNATTLFDASNYDHKLVYILHNVIL